MAPLRALESKLDEQRVQLGAHAQVYQSTQTSMVQQAHTIAALQAESADPQRDVDRPAYEELPMPEPPGPARHRTTMPPRA